MKHLFNLFYDLDKEETFIFGFSLGLLFTLVVLVLAG